jgi:hypothetical protein
MTTGATFNANNGTIRFAGSGSQTVSTPSGVVFYNVEIANTAASPSDSTDVYMYGSQSIANTLTVNDGQISVNGTQVHDLIINVDGIFKLAFSSFVSGDFTLRSHPKILDTVCLVA